MGEGTQPRQIFENHNRCHGVFLFKSLVNQNIVSAFFSTSRQECETSKAFMVACICFHTRNIFRLYWQYTVLLSRSTVGVFGCRLQQGLFWITSAHHFQIELCLGSTHGLFKYARATLLEMYVDRFIVMLIPITLLWKVQMKWRRKAALAGIFSLVIITMIFAMVRTIVAVTSLARQQNLWVNLWSAVEADVGKRDHAFVRLYINFSSNMVYVAIIVACLASFRNLFSRENARRHPKPFISPNRSNLILRGSAPRSKIKRLMDTLASTEEEPHSSYQVQIDGGIDVQSTNKFHQDSSDDITLSDRVHIRQDFDVVREPVRVWSLLIKASDDSKFQLNMVAHFGAEAHS